IYEDEVKGSSTSSQNTQNIAFVSSNNTDSTNESVNDVPSVSAAGSKATVSNFPNVDSLSDAMIYSFFATKIKVFRLKKNLLTMHLWHMPHQAHQVLQDKIMRPDAPIIEDWVSNSEDETEIESVSKQKEPSFSPTSKHVKTPRESGKKVEHPKQAENFRTNNQKSRGHKKTRIRKPILLVEA
nr:hypothetical protein [Tanacetum cinerariifolium]